MELAVENLPANVGDVGDVGLILEEDMQSTPVFLPGEFHGQRCLVGYKVTPSRT